jgi:thiopeptide-type bacteriocin biosynthesis protein
MKGTLSYSSRETPLVVGRTPLLPYSVVDTLYSAHDPEDFVRKLIASRPEIAQAIYVASPSLAEATEAWLGGKRWANKSGFLRLAAYVVRMASRPTPFGLFATIAPVDIGDRTTLGLASADAIRTHSRPDMAWLLGLVRAVEAREDVRERLRVFWNDHALERGGRIHVKNPDGRAFTTDKGAVRVKYAPISLRKTAVVTLIAAASQDGVTFGELCARIVEAAGVQRDAASHMLDGLLRAGVLISELRPAPIDDPVETVQQAFRRVAPDAADAVCSVRAALNHLDETPIAARAVGDYRKTNEVISAVAPSSFTFQVDSTHAFTGTLAGSVLADVETLARIWLRSNVMLRLNAYRERFLERYGGYERRVALLELVDPEFGIGPPPPLEGSQIGVGRRQALLELAAAACREGRHEVALTERELDEIVGPDPDPDGLPTSFEIGFEIVAPNVEAVDGGDYVVAASAMKSSPGAARTIGRFAHALGSRVRTRIDEVVQLERQRDDRRDVELVYFPSRDRVINVAIRPGLRPYEIQFGIRRDEPGVQRLPLADIIIGIERGRFRAWSRTLGCELRITESHVLNADVNAPDVCSFLAAMSEDGMTFPSGFNWGAAGALPVLPRLRFGRVVLAKAMWHVDRRRLGDGAIALEGAIADYRQRLGLPDEVMLVERDNRIPVRLSSRIGLAVLRDQLRRMTGDDVVRFEEVFPEANQLWIARSGDRHSTEFVASFVTTVRRNALPVGSPPGAIAVENRVGPGGEWCYVKLYCGPSNIDHVLASAVAPLVTRLQHERLTDRWFFVRYRDPDEHVRLRFRATVAGRSVLLGVVAETCEGLLRAGIVDRYAFDTYVRELERYGGYEHFDAVEEIFHLDSVAALSLLSDRPSGRDERIRRAVKSLDVILLSNLPLQLVDRALEAIRGERMRLTADAQEMIKELQAAALPAHAHEPPGAFAYLLDRGDGETLTRPLEEIVGSFVHMHFNRMGVAGEDEQMATEIAGRVRRGIARRRLAEPGLSSPQELAAT